ncbi:DNA repair protein RecN [Marinoscillum sp. MHG1-6]|uniref:DNA repair protein RecN n=1 Tax=Marinoscillum sp. MHG1-6 TaxID=2959627 RepID=UPI002157223A|nr:DNA repair protein RecN [Marinoscillum sp. MHG1-6]
MIQSLSINNYALIQQLEMSPSSKLNIITGETGAGKSIMLGAIGLLLGNRADTKALFSEDDKCVVEGIFDISSYSLQSFFDENDLDYEKECIIRREISPAGKSRGFINDTPVTLDIMKSLGVYLIDIHSQHDSLHLANNSYQRDILDLFAGNHEIKEGYHQAFQQFKEAQRHYEDLKFRAEKSATDQDYQQFLFNELEEAQLTEDEQEQLEQELELLEHAEDIKLNLSQLTQLLDEADFSVLNQLKEATSALSSIKKYSHSLEALFERLESCSIELKDLASEVSREQDAIEFDPERIQIVKERLDLIFRLQQKHQVRTISELIEIRDRIGAELESVLNLDADISKAKSALDGAEQVLLEIGENLSKSRDTHAPVFASEIESIVHQLGIENAQISFQIGRVQASSHGLDLVEMLFSANKGVTPKGLKSVASGGEFSRLIFAVKYLIANKTSLPTIIFDEIDTGVSGEVALQMINMMKEMAQSHQVISISHLPQFAAGGDAHYFVYKDHSADKSVSKIKRLQNSERVLEIAKMIGGNQPGDHALQSAKELLGVK